MAGNIQNLKPYAPGRSREEAVKAGRKGGIASGKSRLKKKFGKDLVRALLAMPEKDPRILDEMRQLGILDEDATNEVVMHARQIEKAKRKADTKSYNAILRAAGYTEEEHHDQGLSLAIVVNNQEEKEKIAKIGELDV